MTTPATTRMALALSPRCAKTKSMTAMSSSSSGMMFPLIHDCRLALSPVALISAANSFMVVPLVERHRPGRTSVRPVRQTGECSFKGEAEFSRNLWTTSNRSHGPTGGYVWLPRCPSFGPAGTRQGRLRRHHVMAYGHPWLYPPDPKDAPRQGSGPR